MHIGGLAGRELLGISEAGQLPGGTTPGLVGVGRVMAEPEKGRFQGVLPTACLKAQATIYPLSTAHNYHLLS